MARKNRGLRGKKNANNIIMLHSISSEPGNFEGFFFFFPLQPLASLPSLLLCGTSGVVVFLRNAVTTFSFPVLKSEIEALTMLGCLVQQPGGSCAHGRKLRFLEKQIELDPEGSHLIPRCCSKKHKRASRLRRGRQKLSAPGPTLFVSLPAASQPPPPINFFADSAQ